MSKIAKKDFSAFPTVTRLIFLIGVNLPLIASLRVLDLDEVGKPFARMRTEMPSGERREMLEIDIPAASGVECLER